MAELDEALTAALDDLQVNSAMAQQCPVGLPADQQPCCTAQENGAVEDNCREAAQQEQGSRGSGSQASRRHAIRGGKVLDQSNDSSCGSSSSTIAHKASGAHSHIPLHDNVHDYTSLLAQQFSDRLKAAEAAVTDMQTAQQQLQTVQQHTQQAQAQQAQQAAAMGMMGGAYSRIGTSHGMPPPSSHGMAPPGIMGNMSHRSTSL